MASSAGNGAEFADAVPSRMSRFGQRGGRRVRPSNIQAWNPGRVDTEAFGVGDQVQRFGGGVARDDADLQHQKAAASSTRPP